KELKTGKELYKAEIKDAASGLSVISYFDMENQLMECVRKFGTEMKITDVNDKKNDDNNNNKNNNNGDKKDMPFLISPAASSAATVPQITAQNCPAEISISYDNDLYYVGEAFAVTFKLTDKQGNPMPYKKFSAMPYQDGKALADESFTTDASGTYSAKKILDDGDVGVYEYVAVGNEEACPHVSTTNHFSVHFPTVTADTTGCCELPPRACGEQISKSICTKYGGTFYDQQTHPSYTCVSVEKNPPMSRCRPVTGVRNCASKLDLTFDREQYRVGDSININVIALDKNSNRLPNKEFYVTATKDGKDLGVQTYKTDEKGFYNTGSTLEDDAVGEYVYRAYIKEDGCDYLVDSSVLTISAKLSSTTPTTPTTKQVCPAKIYFAFDKQQYVVGDKIFVKVALMDSNNVAMKGKRFGITLSQNGGELQKAEKQTSEENGVYYEESEIGQSMAGEHEYTVYSQDEGCFQITAKKQITVSAKLDSASTTPTSTAPITNQQSTTPTTTAPITNQQSTSPTQTTNCATKMYFAFNKQSYISGDP
ncbi:MAG: hypothetical protein Q7K43_04645, partial [Candidatus Woesearchaeota archaeon]|nr:hypothetical protein [Candidatus Woesearchaeota archaeon]